MIRMLLVAAGSWYGKFSPVNLYDVRECLTILHAVTVSTFQAHEDLESVETWFLRCLFHSRLHNTFVGANLFLIYALTHSREMAHSDPLHFGAGEYVTLVSYA